MNISFLLVVICCLPSVATCIGQATTDYLLALRQSQDLELIKVQPLLTVSEFNNMQVLGRVALIQDIKAGMVEHWVS